MPQELETYTSMPQELGIFSETEKLKSEQICGFFTSRTEYKIDRSFLYHLQLSQAPLLKNMRVGVKVAPGPWLSIVLAVDQGCC